MLEENENIFEQLRKSPLFAMSLCSKELFHSNFWAWLFEYDIEYVKKFFEKFDNKPEITKNLVVRREEGNRDITVWINNMAYVIENKIKAYPDKNQILEYEKALSEKFGGGILTGITKPDFMKESNTSYNEENPKNWKFLSYNEIGDFILEVVGNKTSFYDNIIREYARLIKNICKVVLDFTKSCNKQLLNEHYCKYEVCQENNCEYNLCRKIKKLNEIRMGDISKKLNANNFLNYLKANIEQEEQFINLGIENYEIHFDCGFTRNQAFVDVRLRAKEEDKKENNKKSKKKMQNMKKKITVMEFKSVFKFKMDNIEDWLKKIVIKSPKTFLLLLAKKNGLTTILIQKVIKKQFLDIKLH